MKSLTRLKPSIFIVGAQKAGTTTLQSLLAKHPVIAIPEEKELAFFNRDEEYEKGVGYYLSRCPEKAFFRKSYTVDATPDYLPDERCAARIQTFAPDAKILMVLREPVERAYSAWNMYRRMLQDKPQIIFDRLATADAEVQAYWRPYLERGLWISFEECVEQELNPTAGPLPDCIRRGLYAEQVKRYLDVFGAEQVKMIRFSDLTQNTDQVMVEVTRFLHLQEFNWAAVNSTSRNRGQYVSPLSDELKAKIKDFYRASNAAVFAMTGWKGY